MKKQTKVLVAAAMLTLGASFTSMAATFDWQLEDGQWVCYDEEGDAYEDEWCESAGKDYWVGEDGVLVTSSWTDDGYYVDSTGAKTTNAWKYILAADADEDEDEAEWFYFDSKGEITTGKKVIDGKTYYFNEDGIMLTGWVKYAAKEATEASVVEDGVVYVDENGARVSNAWVEVYAPEVDEEDEDAEMNWFYIQPKGAPKTGRALDINGETYFFAEDGKMLSGWVGTTNSDTFLEIDDEAKDYTDVYYCGDPDQGWAKKSTWIYDYASYIASPDSDEHEESWFWVDAKGKLLKATKAENVATEMIFDDGEADVPVIADEEGTTTIATTKEINGKDYIFNQNGEMLSGLVEFKGNLFYYGDAEDGSMKTGAVELEDVAEEEAYKFYFAKNDENGYAAEGAAVTGAASGDLYIGGLLETHSKDYLEVFVPELGENGVYFVIDGDGDIKTSKKVYKNDEELAADTTNVTFGTKGALKGSYTK